LINQIKTTQCSKGNDAFSYFFEENMLILAAGFRTAGFTEGLTRLNALRTI
jgi:hypothetical protein